MKKIIYFSFLFLSLISVQAQTGPGGVGSSSNNILWLNADSILLSDSAQVNQWMDISGNGNDAIQTVSTNQPQLIWNGANNHRAVRFDGNNDFFNLSHLTTDNVAIYIVHNNVVPTNVTRYGLTLENHNYVTAKSGNPGDQLSGFEYSGNYYLFAQVASKYENIFGQTLGNSNQLRVSGRGNEAVYTRAALNNNSQSLVGAWYNGVSATGFHHGDIAEIVVFNDTLNLAERRIVINSLTAKYGNNMLVSSLDYFKFQNLNSHDVIGIGQEADGAHTVSKGLGRIEMSNPDDLSNGEYLMIGHDNQSLDTSNQVPAGFTARWERIWRADQTGDVGTVSLEFFLGDDEFGDLSDYYLLIDNDGNFANGGTTQHDFGRTVDAVNGTVAFASVYLPEASYFTLASQDVDNVIESVQSGDWENPTTWDCTCVPTFYSEVIINPTHTVELNDDREVNSLTIDDSAVLNLNPATSFNIYSFLDVTGSMNNIQNTVTTQGGDNIIFSNLGSDPIIFYNLLVENFGGLLMADGDWAIENIIRVRNSPVTNNAGTFTFLSSATQSGQILKTLNFQDAFVGEFIMERYISPRQAAFVNIASPTTTTLSDWDQEIYMSGVGGINGNAQYPGGKIYYSVYGYDNVSQSYDTIKSISEVLQPGYGYELFLGDDLQQYTPTELGTVNVHGDPTSGDITRTVNQGFNFLGNPYQAFLNWGNVSKPADVSTSYYIFNANSGNYQLYPPVQYIPPAQAFWVEKTAAGIATVTFREVDKFTVRIEDSEVFFRKNTIEKDSIRLVLSNNINPFWHEHYLELNPLSSGKEDPNDHGYLPSRVKGVPAIYSSIQRQSDGSKRDLLVNSIGTTESYQRIPLSFTAGLDANYTINFESIGDISQSYSCILFEDKALNTIIDIEQNKKYQFESNEGKYERFVLHLGKTKECDINTLVNASGLSKEFTVEKSSGNYYLYYNIGDRQDVVSIRIIDALGRQVLETQEHSIEEGGSIRINTSDLEGIYLIQIESQDGRTYSNKFYF